MKRIYSVDLIRGAVMMLMALDHVRVYSGIPAGGPEPGVFLTRWVTHFCAPAFFFLAGTSAFLSMERRGRAGIAKTLVARGLWLIFLELTVIRISWTFNVDVGFLMAGVIWSLGWCMILMGGLVFLPRAVLAAVGLAIVLLHNLVAGAFMTGSPWQESYAWFWRIVYTGGYISFGESGFGLGILYSIVPWIGVMAAGYAFGPLLRMEVPRRDRACFAIGATMIAAFLVLRGTDAYGDPRPTSAFGPDWPGWITFLNTTKYPASLSYLLMTLGPTILSIPFLERTRGALASVVGQFGRVPMFFYLLHIPLIHAAAMLVAVVRSPEAIPWLLDSHPIPDGAPPEGYTYSLPLLYLLTGAVLTLAYAACRWWDGVRPRLPRRVRSLL
jgi:uncharacterized membrane protein